MTESFVNFSLVKVITLIFVIEFEKFVSVKAKPVIRSGGGCLSRIKSLAFFVIMIMLISVLIIMLIMLLPVRTRSYIAMIMVKFHT